MRDHLIEIAKRIAAHLHLEEAHPLTLLGRNVSLTVTEGDAPCLQFDCGGLTSFTPYEASEEAFLALKSFARTVEAVDSSLHPVAHTQIIIDETRLPLGLPPLGFVLSWSQSVPAVPAAWGGSQVVYRSGTRRLVIRSDGIKLKAHADAKGPAGVRVVRLPEDLGKTATWTSGGWSEVARRDRAREMAAWILSHWEEIEQVLGASDGP